MEPRSAHLNSSSAVVLIVLMIFIGATLLNTGPNIVLSGVTSGVRSESIDSPFFHVATATSRRSSADMIKPGADLLAAVTFEMPNSPSAQRWKLLDCSKLTESLSCLNSAWHRHKITMPYAATESKWANARALELAGMMRGAESV